jgi:hypothetical protein
LGPVTRSDYACGVSALRRVWRRSPIVRILAVGYLIVVSGGAGLVAFGALANLWADDQDSGTGTYLAIGLPALSICIVALFAALQIWRDR